MEDIKRCSRFDRSRKVGDHYLYSIQCEEYCGVMNENLDFIELLHNRILGVSYNQYIETLELTGNENILVFGCGSGTFLRCIAPHLPNGLITAVDTSLFWIDIAKNQLRCKNVEFKCGELPDVDIKDEFYDIVFIHYVLHDIPVHERSGLVHELVKKLKSEGKLFIKELIERHGIPVE